MQRPTQYSTIWVSLCHAYLFVDGRALTKHVPAADETSNERMVGALLPAGRQVTQYGQDSLVNRHVRSQTHSVLARGGQNLAELFTRGTRAKKKDHDQGVREANFGTIHETVPRALHNGEHIMVRGVQDKLRERSLDLRHVPHRTKVPYGAPADPNLPDKPPPPRADLMFMDALGPPISFSGEVALLTYVPKGHVNAESVCYAPMYTGWNDACDL